LKQRQPSRQQNKEKRLVGQPMPTVRRILPEIQWRVVRLISVHLYDDSSLG
jgi:hypothetical protein